MSYSNPHVATYTFGEHDFGAGGDALAIKSPKGFESGRIVDIGVMVTETFTAVTTPAFVRLGTATDPDAYAELNLGTAVNTDYYNTRDDTDAVIQGDITEAQIEVAFVAPTGGTPAGRGHVNIIIAWH